MDELDLELQEQLNDDLVRAIEQPVVIDWCDYVARCIWCDRTLAFFEHQVERGHLFSDTLFGTCPACGQGTAFVPHEAEIRR